jgi:hypothetical protein
LLAIGNSTLDDHLTPSMHGCRHNEAKKLHESYKYSVNLKAISHESPVFFVC